MDNLIDRMNVFNSQMVDINVTIILVNDGSSKNLDDDIKRLFSEFPNIIYINNTVNKGKGHAIRTGLAKSASSIIMYTDIDIPFTPVSMRNVVNQVVNANADIAVGVRSESYYSNIPKSRKMISRVFKSAIGFLFALPINDTQGGLKAMNVKGKEALAITKTNGYLFDLEFIKHAGRRKLNVCPVVVETMKDYQNEGLGSSIIKRELFDFVRIWWRR
mgnify:CR=1 FL=1